MNRRNFLKIAAGSLALAAAAPVVYYGACVEPVKFEVVEQPIPLRRLGPGLQNIRAVQISDIHIGDWFPRERLETVINRVIELQPDLVLITGDYLVMRGDYPKMTADLYDPLSELCRYLPVYSVMGNHDLIEGLGSKLHKMLKETGIQDVTNTYTSYQKGGDSLFLAGVGTLSTGDMHLREVTRRVPTDSAVILLAHEPDIAQWTREYPQYVMQLSGHTHGGQIVFPIGHLADLPWMGKLYPSGLYDLDSMYLYTNRGLGMTRVPIRLNCPPEITVFTFTQA